MDGLLLVVIVMLIVMGIIMIVVFMLDIICENSSVRIVSDSCRIYGVVWFR